jgi:hypothetical protein
MNFEYLALIGAALFLSNALGDLRGAATWLTLGDICIAVAIIFAYIDVFIKQLTPYKKYLTGGAMVLASLGVASYIKNFI